MMGNKRPVYFRIIAGVIAVALIGMIGLITNSFTGNPISAYIAGRQMEKYVEEKYTDMNLEFTKAKYNFKFGAYVLKASDPNSSDTHFAVTRRSDGYIYDDYENSVLGGYNTLDRLGKEMTKEIEPMLKNIFGEELSGRCFAECFGSNKSLQNVPSLDTPFNRDIKLKASIFLDFEIENPTLENIAEKLKKANELLEKEGFSVDRYVVQAINPSTKKGYMVQVDKKLINENLLEALEKTIDSEEYDESIYVHALR